MTERELAEFLMGGEKKDRVFHVRVPHRLYRVLSKRARRRGVAVSAHVRELLLADAVLEFPEDQEVHGLGSIQRDLEDG